ncbi:MAG: 8-amino-7-oxononanoate synthase [Chthoniobacterales bacterium]|nr:8-amino-7-oxononanoate synthase [Chthoniobacterales bacterium]
MIQLQERLSAELGRIKEKKLWRSPAVIERVRRGHLLVGDQELCNFSSSDYLGLASHPQLCYAAQEAMKRFGFGATASRLVCGTSKEHAALEEELAAVTNQEAALLFPTGFAAATGALSVLLEHGDIIILDKLAHACLIDGARASKATLRIFHHNDLEHLEKQLRWARQKFPQGVILIVTESAFSMDGDVAPLREIVALKERYGALLFVDEAHVIGVRGLAGKRMGGLIGELGLSQHVEIQMGTMSKAMGATGGYLCASRCLIDYLLHRARSFIYTTAAPPSSIAAARAALRIINSQEGETLAQQLWQNIHYFTKLASWPTKPVSAIFPLIIGDEKKTLATSCELLKGGFFLSALRYPSVPRGAARLRLTLTASHRADEIESLTKALGAINELHQTSLPTYFPKKELTGMEAIEGMAEKNE